jgi:uncharacterized RDD family membrane protein YckC
MDRKYLLESPIKTAKLTRLIAKAIDFFIVLILTIFLYPIGVILAGIYISFCDSFQGGQSVGKKFIGLKVVSSEDGSPCTYKQSFIRNLPILIPLSLAIVPIWGWVISFILGSVLILLELYLLITLDSGLRLGDVMADTTIVSSDDLKVSTIDKNSTTTI